MIEVTVALLMLINGEIKEHRIQIDPDTGKPSMSKCLKGKRIAMRSAGSNVEYHCLKAKVETEIYMGEKSIKKIIIE